MTPTPDLDAIDPAATSDGRVGGDLRGIVPPNVTAPEPPGLDGFVPAPTPERAVYCNRTVNLRRIRAIGYDLDYTLVHYRVDEWERAAFERARELLAVRGWPVEGLSFDPDAYIQGLVFDLELGNILKASRYGYVIRAQHGTRAVSFPDLRDSYSGAFVDLGEDRFEFMNTLFSLSQASLFAQLVDLADADRLPGATGYRDVWQVLGEVLEESHTQGELKSRIVAEPDRFVEPDPDLPLTLLDQREAGKKLLLVTNSDWTYTRAMMSYALEPFLPDGVHWRELFHLVIVDADKPRFFSGRSPVYEVVEEDVGRRASTGAGAGAVAGAVDGEAGAGLVGLGPVPLLRRHRGLLERGKVYSGGDATLVERSLGLAGAEMLYLGDHLFGDVHVTKEMLRWRTGLILRELEHEVRCLVDFQPTEAELARLMVEKTRLDREIALLRLARLRRRRASGPVPVIDHLPRRLQEATSRSLALDAVIAPLAEAAGRVANETWGPLLRAGGDRSLFARQVERYADLYTSRVSNLLAETPYAYLRAIRTNLPHDPF
jgi:HAD superfamily 5'-nucleotidase-like hydrolase